MAKHLTDTSVGEMPSQFAYLVQMSVLNYGKEEEREAEMSPDGCNPGARAARRACPAVASGPEPGSRQDFGKGNLDQGHPGAKGTLLAEAHPRCSASVSPHLSDVNKPGPQSETLLARCRAGSLPSLPGRASRGQV